MWASSSSPHRFMRGMVVLGGFLVFMTIPSLIDSAEILGIQAPRGSMMGGTYVTIWGSGFSRNGREGQTVAYVFHFYN